MPKTLDDALKVLKERARKRGPEHAELYDALDRHFGEEVEGVLAALRTEKKLSQAELGRKAKVEQAEVSRILSGKSDPRLSTVKKLAAAMGARLRVAPLSSSRTVRIHSKSSKPRK